MKIHRNHEVRTYYPLCLDWYDGRVYDCCPECNHLRSINPVSVANTT